MVGSGKTGQSSQALLVIPGNNIESAKEIIKSAFQNSNQMNEWMLENGWNQLIETEQ